MTKSVSHFPNRTGGDFSEMDRESERDAVAETLTAIRILSPTSDAHDGDQSLFIVKKVSDNLTLCRLNN